MVSTTTQNSLGVVSIQPPVIQIGTIQSAIGIIVFLVTVGIAWGSLRTLVKGIKTTLDNEIKPDLKNVRERFGKTEDRVETLWKDKFAPAHSPRQLNERGNDVLKTSGIKEIIDQKKDELLKIIKTKDISNPYDAEQTILAVVGEMPKHCPDVVDKIKDGAFKSGVDIEGVLFVGGLYLRNLIFKPNLGFDLIDLDKPKTS